jgi:ribonuclease R
MHNDIALFTIDEPHSRDLDDAIGVARTGSGWVVRVAIANPAAAVAIGSAEDLAARAQGATIYRGREATQPMLPRSISEGHATLTAGERRSAMLIDLELDQAGQVVDTRVSLGEITVVQRLSYGDVPTIADSEEHPLHAPMIEAIAIARGFLKQRRSRGALAFLDQQQMMLTDEEGRIQIFDASEMVGHVLVQEMMIATNAAVAKFAVEKDIPFLYRCHEPRLAAPRGLAAAESFEGWLAGGHASTAAAAERLNLIAQKARYTSVLTGHYGLNLPAYAHVTSPLRRYADLVDQRQLSAMILGLPLPYSQDDLAAIGDELFQQSIARAEATSDFFKARSAETAQAAVDSNSSVALRWLPDAEMGQAVMSALEGGFGPALIDELLRRMTAGTLADKIAMRFVEGRDALPKAVAVGFIAMVGAKPASAMAVVNHARSIDVITRFEVDFEEIAGRAAPTFRARALMRDAHGETYTAVAKDSRKKSAEQAATLLCLCDLMKVERPAGTVAPAAAPSPTAAPSVPSNAKGALLEFCTKRKLGAPTFHSTSTGPSNAPAFVCVVELALDDRSVTVRSPEASTKRQAEALAAAGLLEQLAQTNPPATPAVKATTPTVPGDAQGAAPVPDVVNRGRAIQLLQEHAQKARLAPPAYEFIEISKTPSSFECRVSMFLADGAVELRATDTTKQGSKAAAAALVLERIGLAE